MGYTIIYGRQFIKTSKGIIPMVLAGSNNCTEVINGKEVLERRWWPITLAPAEVSPLRAANDLLDSAAKLANGDNADYEFAKYGGKWIYYSGTEKWFRNGIDHAMTIERIRQLRPNQKLRGGVYVRTKPNDTERLENVENLCDTASIERWIDEKG